MHAAIRAIDYHLPSKVVSNDDLHAEFPEWTVDKIAEKTGIRARHIARDDECASDLGVQAAEKLFANGVCRRNDVDFLLFCTQSPDYFLPTTSCIMQQRLGIPDSAGALDVNLGCSGFVYGLGVAKGLIETRQARGVLLITAETYSKFMHPTDKTVRTIFGDGAAATFVAASESSGEPALGPFVYGTDGTGAEKLIVRVGGMRTPVAAPDLNSSSIVDAPRNGKYLCMNGPEIFEFTLRVVPECVQRLLALSGKRQNDIDLFVFHQANQFILQCLRRKLKIPEDKFVIFLERCGNTVCSSIPIALKEARAKGILKPGQLVMLVGFGVGLSWGASLVRWSA